MTSLIVLISVLSGFLFQYSECYNDTLEGIYETYPIDPSFRSFGYDNSNVCILKNIDGAFYAGLANAYSVFKGPYTKISSDPASTIHNCFSYKGHSYLITKLNNNTTIMRAHLSRSFILQNYDKLIFDHLTSKLYSLDGNKIYKFNLDTLEKFWTIKNYPQKLLEQSSTNARGGNASLRTMFTFTNQINRKFDDIMIFNNTIYYTSNNPGMHTHIYKKFINGGNEDFVSLTYGSKFDFIPFLRISEFYLDNPKHNKYSLGSSQPIVITLPSTNFKTPEGGLALPLVILLYFLDAIFIILTVWGLKLLYKFTKEKYNMQVGRRQKANDDIEGDQHFNQESLNDYIPLASSPYRNIIVNDQFTNSREQKV